MSARAGVSPRVGDLRRQLLADLPVSERQLQLAGMSTAVVEGGIGPPIVLLHGPAANATHWMRVIPRLAAARRVIAPDLPGHGKSDSGAWSLDAERMVAWLEELIERTCTSPPVLVGQHVGGAIAMRFASRYDARVDRLVLADTFGLAPFSPEPAFGDAVNAFFASPVERNYHELWGQCAFDLDKLRERVGERWQLFESYNLDSARASLGAARDLIEYAGHPLDARELARITVPTLLIWGRHDRANPLGVALDASARHGWPLVVIDDAADEPSLEQPEAFVRALRHFLQERA